MLLPPLGHPEAAEPHVPEDESTLQGEAAEHTGQACMPIPSVTAVGGGNEAPSHL